MTNKITEQNVVILFHKNENHDILSPKSVHGKKVENVYKELIKKGLSFALNLSTFRDIQIINFQAQHLLDLLQLLQTQSFHLFLRSS